MNTQNEILGAAGGRELAVRRSGGYSGSPREDYELLADQLLLTGFRPDAENRDQIIRDQWQQLYSKPVGPQSYEALCRGLYRSTINVLEREDSRIALVIRSNLLFIQDRLLRYCRLEMGANCSAQDLLERLTAEMLALTGEDMRQEVEEAARFVVKKKCADENRNVLPLRRYNAGEQRVIRAMYRYIRQHVAMGSKEVLQLIRGEAAVDYLLMLRSDIEDEPDSAEVPEEELWAEKFEAACRMAPKYASLTPEACGRLWRSVLEEDRLLFGSGSLSRMVDSRTAIIVSRCLLLAMQQLPLPPSGGVPAEDVVARTQELIRPFLLDYAPALILGQVRRAVRQFSYRQTVVRDYLLEVRAPDIRGDIASAYAWHLAQRGDELKKFREEVNRLAAEKRQEDLQQMREENRKNMLKAAEILALPEKNGPLGLLFTAARGKKIMGEPITAQKLRFALVKLENQMAQLGLVPLGLDRIDDEGRFTAGAGTEEFWDDQGNQLAEGKRYMLLEPGWKFMDRMIRRPTARLLDE